MHTDKVKGEGKVVPLLN